MAAVMNVDPINEDHDSWRVRPFTAYHYSHIPTSEITILHENILDVRLRLSGVGMADYKPDIQSMIHPCRVHRHVFRDYIAYRYVLKVYSGLPNATLIGAQYDVVPTANVVAVYGEILKPDFSETIVVSCLAKVERARPIRSKLNSDRVLADNLQPILQILRQDGRALPDISSALKHNQAPCASQGIDRSLEHCGGIGTEVVNLACTVVSCFDTSIRVNEDSVAWALA